LRFELVGPGAADLALPRGVVVERRESNRLSLCVAVPGRAEQRRVTLGFAYTAPAMSPSGSPFDGTSRPAAGVYLAAMSADTQGCRRMRPKS
jgi:hypothetical protein